MLRVPRIPKVRLPNFVEVPVQDPLAAVKVLGGRGVNVRVDGAPGAVGPARGRRDRLLVLQVPPRGKLADELHLALTAGAEVLEDAFAEVDAGGELARNALAPDRVKTPDQVALVAERDVEPVDRGDAVALMAGAVTVWCSEYYLSITASWRRCCTMISISVSRVCSPCFLLPKA